MPSTTSLASRLAADFTQIHFVEGSDFHWSPTDKTISYIPVSQNTAALLHEVAHAILGHASYKRDVELLERERSAWTYAYRELSGRYEVPMSEDDIQQALDTYRDWLHARSTCPACEATGIQTKQSEYKCIACHTVWKVNDARICALRRYKQTK